MLWFSSVFWEQWLIFKELLHLYWPLSQFNNPSIFLWFFDIIIHLNLNENISRKEGSLFLSFWGVETESYLQNSQNFSIFPVGWRGVKFEFYLKIGMYMYSHFFQGRWGRIWRRKMVCTFDTPHHPFSGSRRGVRFEF